MDRRRLLRTCGACLGASLGGCLSTPEVPGSDVDERIYTCSYDAQAFALSDSGESYDELWNWSRDDQTTDIQVDRNHDVLLCNRSRGLEKWEYGDRPPTLRWRYEGLTGSIRGISVDKNNDYYLGSWTEHGFHKVVEEDGRPRRAWEYTWDGEDGMIASAPNRSGEVAVGLKNNEVHLLGDIDGEPHRYWTWTPNTDRIVRELLWGSDDELYVGCEDHRLYKLVDTGPEGEPTLEWAYDSGNIVFGASRTLEGDLYVATNAGEVHHVREEDGEPERQWVYHHTEPDGPVPDDEYWWDGKAHQVAVRPDGSELYSCAYDGTVHKVIEEDGGPRRVWEFDGHTDNVREVRVAYESLGTWPEYW